MRIPPPPQAQGEPNVTPFLDVLLVLLVIFMIPFLHPRKALQVQLPQPSHGGADAPAIVLEVKPNAVYLVNQRNVPQENLAATLRDMYAGRPTKTLIIRGDPTVKYQDVIHAVDVARGAGVLAIGVTTDHHR